MNCSNERAPLQFANNYEEKCFNHFIRISQHEDCRLRFATCSTDIKAFYYYCNDELFDVNKDINILRQFLKKCKFDKLGCNTTAEIGINNSTGNNYSDIIFNRQNNFKFLTRLDIKKRQFFLGKKKNAIKTKFSSWKLFYFKQKRTFIVFFLSKKELITYFAKVAKKKIVIYAIVLHL